MSKFLTSIEHLNEVRAYMKNNKIRHKPFTKLVNRGKYKYLCEIMNSENLTSVQIGLHGMIEIPDQNEKYYKPGFVTL